MAKKSKLTLDDCRSGRDFMAYCARHPETREMRQNGSSHVVVKGPKPGSAVFPHPERSDPLPTGTRRSVIKMLMLIGLGVFILIAIL